MPYDKSPRNDGLTKEYFKTFWPKIKNSFLSYSLHSSGFYPSTFLHAVNGSKNSILYWVFKLNLLKSLQVFSLCLSRKTLDRFFILLHHCFCSYKPQICTNQTGLTIRFITPQKSLCSCVQKIKNKHDGGADVCFFFVSVCVTHSLVERLTMLVGL